MSICFPIWWKKIASNIKTQQQYFFKQIETLAMSNIKMFEMYWILCFLLDMWKHNKPAIIVDPNVKRHNEARLPFMMNTQRQTSCIDRRLTCLTGIDAELLAISGKRLDSSRTPTVWPSYRTDPIPVKRLSTLHHLFWSISDREPVVVRNYVRTTHIYLD